MCGRYSLEARPDELVDAFALAEAISFSSRYNIAPQQDVPVVRADPGTGRRSAALGHWGFTPPPRRGDGPAPRSIINARSETVDTRGLFKASFLERRCLVPATGFYEWQKLDGARQPFHVRRRNRGLFAFAGIWHRRRDAPDAEAPFAFAILTTAPNATMTGIHDRMPVILDPAACALWLDPEVRSPGPLKPLLASAPDDLLTAYPVSRHVNKPANDDPACVAPLETRPASQGSLFDERPVAGSRRQGRGSAGD